MAEPVIFVVGNGPTMADIDVSLLQEYDTIVFNDFTHRMRELLPTYWLYSDNVFYRPYRKYLNFARKKGVKMISGTDKGNVDIVLSTFGHTSYLKNGKIEFYDKKLKPHGTHRVYSVGAGVYLGLQWAWQAGYRIFYVMGLDSRDARTKDHYTEKYNELVTMNSGKSGLPKDIWGKGYDYANKWIWDHGGEIWDISGSRCRSFQRKTLDEVLNG